jgi:hypothetical protein
MCNFFSFLGDGYGNYKYCDWDIRKKWLKTDKSPDSHTTILAHFKIPAKMQDRWSKYEFNPITKQFTVDQGVEGHDHASAEAWINALDFKAVVPALIIKPIFNPLFKIQKVTEEDIALLKEWASVGASMGASVWASVWASVGDSVWASVWASMRDSVWASVWASVGDSVWDSVRDSVWASVRDSVWASVRDSVEASVWAYISSYFDIKYKYNFSSCIELWNKSLVPVFDGINWYLCSGKNATIVYTWKKGEE